MKHPAKMLTALCRVLLIALFAGAVCMAPAQALDLPKHDHIQFKPASESDDGMVYRAIAAFLVAGGAAYGLAWAIKRFLPALGKTMGQDRKLQQLEVMRLTTRSVLIRVRYGDEELLIGENEHGISLLAKRPLDAAAAAPAREEDRRE
ncbi:MAG: FliO/MopB family protein [Burkholderiales bacterium]|nr:FliO/MopB family protein [Burkholderiales bacterium]